MVVRSVFKETGAWRLSIVLLLAFFGFSASLPAHAQNLGGSSSLLDLSPTDILLQLQQRAQSGSLTAPAVALEGALNPAEYVVGPGDQFSIAIGGISPTRQLTSISADGNLVLPEVSLIRAAGRTLEVVQRETLALLKKYYPNALVEISLVSPRQFYIHISGAVPEPGRYLVIPVSRVSDALELAYAAKSYELQYLSATADLPPNVERPPVVFPSATSERPTLNESFQPALRNVHLTRRDGTQEVLDLIRYYTTGETEHNPYLLDGDVIMVPAYHLRRDAIRASGEVAYPGTFDYRPGDTVLDLLLLATGPNGLGALGEMRLTRTHSNGRTEIIPLDARDILAGRIADPALQPGDHLSVLPEDIAQAAIQGRIQYPGTYRIENGKTTLRELLDLAGGLQSDANLRAAFLERRKSLDFVESGRISDLDFFSRTYLESFASGAKRVIIDIEAALQEGGEDIVLYDEDRVVFPRDEGTVFVMGNVPRPGYVEYVEGQSARYYVDQAGGVGPTSLNIYVFEDGTGRVLLGAGSLVRSGDTVFVDRKDVAESPELAQLLLVQQQSRRQARISTTQTIIAGISAITSVLTVFVALRSIN